MTVPNEDIAASRVTSGPMIHIGVGDKATGETAVYWLRDRAGRLLYVGMSRNPLARWSCHADAHEWWPQVATFEISWFASRGEAAQTEYEAIKDGMALHNKHSTPRHGEFTEAGVQRALAAQRLKSASA